MSDLTEEISVDLDDLMQPHETDSGEEARRTAIKQIYSWPFYKEHFELVDIDDRGNIASTCLHCKKANQEKTVYKSALSSSTNLRMHLERLHKIHVEPVRRLAPKNQRPIKAIPASLMDKTVEEIIADLVKQNKGISKETTAKLHAKWPFFKNNFHPIEVGSKGEVSAVCLHCKKNNQEKHIYKANLNSPSNFKIHLRRMHNINIPQYNTFCRISLTKAFKRPKLLGSAYNANNVASSNAQKPIIIIEELLAKIVQENALPYTIVESRSVGNLIKKLTGAYQPCDAETIRCLIEKSYDDIEEQLQETLSEVKTVALSSDAWTCYERDILVTVVHWIDTNTLKRKHAILSFRHMLPNTLTYDEFYNFLQEDMRKYSINEKTVSLTTSAGRGYEMTCRCPGLFESWVEEDPNEYKVFTVDGIKVIANVVDPFPPRFASIAHKLNQIPSKYLMNLNTEEESGMTMMYNSVCEKIQSLLLLQQQHVDNANMIRGTLGDYLKIPSPEVWSSLFDAFRNITQHKDKMETLTDRLNINSFTACEFEFMEEFHRVMKPISVVINSVQEEKEAFLGSLYPMLWLVKSKYEEFSKATSIIYCTELVNIIVSEISSQFKDLDQHKEVMYATILHPSSKRLPTNEYYRIHRMYLADLLALSSNTAANTNQNQADDAEDTSENLWDSLSISEETGSVSSQTTNEINSWVDRLTMRTDLKLLKEFPTVMELFITYNTTVMSTAIAEKTFNKAVELLSWRNFKPNDENLERFLKLNLNENNF